MPAPANGIEVSVIIPMRNVHRYIRRCATSLFEQTLGPEIEFIFVDDASTDSTVQVLTDTLLNYPERVRNYRLLHHSERLGAAAARNTGLTCAVGRYVAFCDADDWVETDIYRLMLQSAQEADADYVNVDFLREYVGSRRRIRTHLKPDSRDNLRDLLRGKRLPCVWNMLIRRSVFADHAIRFPEDADIWEDLAVAARVLYFSDKNVLIPKPLYHLNAVNPDALSQHITLDAANGMTSVIRGLQEFLEQHGEQEMVRLLDYKKLDLRLHYMLNGDNTRFPEAMRSLGSHKCMPRYWRTAMRLYDTFGYTPFAILAGLAGHTRD